MMNLPTTAAALLFATGCLAITARGQSTTAQADQDPPGWASHFARLALHCIGTEFPNKTGHVLMDSADRDAPRALHPAFYGCFDWHSSVHGHWMLVRLLRLYPQLPDASDIRQALSRNLTAANLAAEAAYFDRPGTRTFERMYGWAWLLKLAGELDGWDDAGGRAWRESIRPLERKIVERYFSFLPLQTYPIRSGEHPNTAFGMSFAWDYAQITGNDSLLDLLAARARDYFLRDESCPASWEPGGSDFLSPCLVEADLMRRVLPVMEYREWLRHFLPGLEEGKPLSLMKPALVSDRSDPKIVHLDGLNLSRAWCLYGIRNTLYAPDDRRTIIAQAADAHLQAALPHIASGDYAGEHWLASFAVYTLSLKD
jgi:hypothetical protein